MRETKDCNFIYYIRLKKKKL